MPLLTFNDWMETDEAKDAASGYILSRVSMFFDQFEYQAFMRQVFDTQQLKAGKANFFNVDPKIDKEIDTYFAGSNKHDKEDKWLDI